jgi:hypothetical protein
MLVLDDLSTLEHQRGSCAVAFKLARHFLGKPGFQLSLQARAENAAVILATQLCRGAEQDRRATGGSALVDGCE